MNSFTKRRNDALASLNEDTIKQYMKVCGIPLPPDRVFWLSVHKAITACIGLPIEFRRKSKKWLEKRGSASMDDGDI